MSKTGRMNFLKPTVVVDGKKYTLGKKVGEGAYSFVHKAKKDGVKYALKKTLCQTQELLNSAEKEVRVLKRINHENVISCIASELKAGKNGEKEVLMITPLYVHGSLQQFVDAGKYPAHGFSSNEHIKNVFPRIIEGCLRGLQAIHDAGYRHADFKPDNVLLKGIDCTPAIADFGSAVPIPQIIRTTKEARMVEEYAAANTTASYRAPELFQVPMTSTECVLDGKSDVWSLGCLCYALMYSRNPFETPAEGLSSLAVQSATFRIPETQSAEELRALYGLYTALIVEKCLVVSLEKRADIAALVNAYSQPAIVAAMTAYPTVARAQEPFDPFGNNKSVNLSLEEDEFGEFQSS